MTIEEYFQSWMIDDPQKRGRAKKRDWLLKSTRLANAVNRYSICQNNTTSNYSLWVARITQSGLNNPAAIIIYNDFSSTPITMQRTTSGSFDFIHPLFAGNFRKFFFKIQMISGDGLKTVQSYGNPDWTWMSNFNFSNAYWHELQNGNYLTYEDNYDFFIEMRYYPDATIIY